MLTLADQEIGLHSNKTFWHVCKRNFYDFDDNSDNNYSKDSNDGNNDSNNK